MKFSNNSCELIPGVSIFNCFRPYRISIPLAMVWGLFKCDVAYFPKHLDTPNWILKFAKIIRRPVFTTIEMNMCDRTKLNMIDNFGDVDKMKKHFDLIPYIYGISRFIIDKSTCGVKLQKNPLYLGVENDHFLSEKSKLLKNIVFIGSLIQKKNIEEFFRLAKTFPNLNFHIIGNKKYLKVSKKKKINYKEQWKNRINKNIELEFLDNITLHGKLNRDTLPKILRNMDLLFLPSRSEGFPKVILEAAASGVPSVVYSDYGALEWIENKKNGFVVNEFDEVINIVNQLIHKPKLLQSCSKDVVCLSQEFSWKNKIKLWEDEINNILND
ncbi:MAG: glycosyltransferase family 4 protein [Flavobacteriales bacterium]